MGVTTGTLTSATQGAAVALDSGDFSLEIWGTFVGTVRLERRTDGTNWIPLFVNAAAHSRTTPCAENFNDEAVDEAEYRVACTAYTSGTINWALRQK